MNTVKTLTDDELWNIVEDIRKDLRAGKTLCEYARESYDRAIDELIVRGWC